VVCRPTGVGVAALSSDQGGRTVHFWNKLSTAALMRLTILASLNLIMGRVLGGWLFMLHPLFFLTVLTIDLGLYALMVYSGTLNKTLIAMMLAGLAGVLAVIAYAGADESAFAYGGRFQEIARWLEGVVNMALEALSVSASRARPKRFWWQHGLLIAYLAVDFIGLLMIAAGGLVARILQAGSRHRGTSAPHPSS
jgi:hypothetical protein